MSTDQRRQRSFITRTHVIWLLSSVIVLLLYEQIFKALLIRLHVSVGLVESIPHFIVTLLAVCVGAFIDRNFLFKGIEEGMTRQLRESESAITESIRDQVIPMASQFGLSSISDGLDVRAVIHALSPNDHIDIMFTFHPDFEQYLPDLIKKVAENGVKARLLFGDPNSEIVQTRFDYITETSGVFSWNDNMVAKLRMFINDRIRPTIENTRDYKRGTRFQFRTFSRLPDLPLIIVRSGSDQGPIGIRQVLQGFYLRRPAVELPFMCWIDNPQGGGRREALANLLLQYFEIRWQNGSDLGFVDRPQADIT